MLAYFPISLRSFAEVLTRSLDSRKHLRDAGVFLWKLPNPTCTPPPPPPIPLAKQIMVHLLLCARHAIAPRRKILREIASNTAKCNVCTWLGSWLNSQKVPVSNPKHISSRNDETAKTESFPTFAAKCFCLGIDHALLQAQQSQESFVLLH